ncbi:membrane-bound PQQ-dependent dehydrogenase, glucose/quinate/shikimate family [Comamonas fluminis]|uniref:membrane-bound PQQ-dependent dehydrogenase, glucose/quinate/shikimate family n=1 Tax=Comamonas fluminis TaxID=2796366 RepID=UPI001C48A8C6|nr:membrane-bound PQQ-dependent dehydrogenase, glucose/quinate/shikimate family [Comamonas fluminis]
MTDAEHPQKGSVSIRNTVRIVFSLLVLLVSLGLIYGGFQLAGLGGSKYYLIAGLAYLVLAGLFVARKRIALPFSVVIFVATLIWALCDVVHFSYWELLPRLVVPALILMVGLWVGAAMPGTAAAPRRAANGFGGAIFLALLATLVAAFFPHGTTLNPVAAAKDIKDAVASSNDEKAPENWEFYGRSASGTRFAPYSDITPENVKDLQVAWTYHTGRRTTGSAFGVDENTPLQIGNVLYTCTPENVVAAVDGDSGKELWKFDPHAKSEEHVTCRGVGYHDMDKDNSLSAVTKAAYATVQQCRQRILVSTIDARMFALDAHTGVPCEDFGEHGFIDLKKGMGPTEVSKRYHPTAVPVVMNHLAVVGGWVRDIVAGEPSGAVRAFDVLTGKIAWAWDIGAPEGADVSAPDHQFTLETPNVWTVPTFDKDLNLVYLPTGNGPPDYWAGDRSKIKEKYGSAIVAVDASTGKEKWTFQTVHHDVWDFDVPSQPVLYSMKNDKGEKTPVLIQTTKTGHIFVLDRRDGTPFTKVEERPVVTSPAAEGEHLSPTQPYSVGMPTIGVEPLSESAMWGVSMFDQLYCRIKFKDSVYVGPFTPPTEKPYIEWPSLLGGMNWGGISIDENTGMMFVNDMRMPLRMSLVTQENAKKFKVTTDEVPGFMGTIRPQIAGIYGGVKIDIMQSPLGVPCNTPPFGSMSGIDLNTQKLVWQVPLGTVQDTGPMGTKTHMQIPLGMPTLGGPTSTASGLVFFAGTQDYYLRAMDSKTGKEVWKARMPVGAVAAPLIYKSPKTGKQYVVISAGGASHSPDLGDYVIAYALPDSADKK